MPATYRKYGEHYVSNRVWVMRKPGRRSKLTPEMRSEVLQRLLEGEGRAKVIRACCVPRQTFHRWMDSDETFRWDVIKAEGLAREIKEGLLDDLVSGLRDMVSRTSQIPSKP
jgi:hypothetical protein